MGTAQGRPWRRTVRDIVDQVYLGEAGAPPGAVGALFAVLDDLRSRRARADDIAHLEQVSLGLHRLHRLLHTLGKDSVAASVQRTSLYRSTMHWLENAPMGEFA